MAAERDEPKSIYDEFARKERLRREGIRYLRQAIKYVEGYIGGRIRMLIDADYDDPNPWVWIRLAIYPEFLEGITEQPREIESKAEEKTEEKQEEEETSEK